MDERYNLSAPYVDRGFVKNAGAMWDSVNKTWYITKEQFDKHGELFTRWSPKKSSECTESSTKKRKRTWNAPEPISCDVVDEITKMPWNQHKYDTSGTCSVMGANAERMFLTLARTRGYTVVPTSLRDDIFHHQDFHLKSKDGRDFTVDVKSEKRISRGDESVTADMVWLELHGIQKNDEGWLFSDHAATWIAFQRATGFLIMSRKRLAAHVRTLWKPDDPYVLNARDALYKPYARRRACGQIGYDVLMRARLKDLIENSDALIDVWSPE